MKKSLKTLTPEQAGKLLDALREHHDTSRSTLNAQRNFTMALLMLDAGLRVGEVVRLPRTSLWFASEPTTAITVPANITKSKRERTVPTTERLQRAFVTMSRLWWRDDPPTPRAFAFHRYSSVWPLSVRQVERIITAAGMVALGINVHPHQLRHTFATSLMNKTNIRVVQDLLGHKSVQSTQIYTHPNQTDYQKAIDSLNDTPVK